MYHEDEICAGDLMMVLKQLPLIDPNSSKMGFIANGDALEILRIQKIQDLYGFTFADVTVRMIDYDNEPEFECKLLLDTIMEMDHHWDMNVKNELFRSIEMDFMDIKNKKRAALVMKKSLLQRPSSEVFYAVTCHIKHKVANGQSFLLIKVFPDGIDHISSLALYSHYQSKRKVYFLNFKAFNYVSVKNPSQSSQVDLEGFQF